jgi:hypothetical protein
MKPFPWRQSLVPLLTIVWGGGLAGCHKDGAASTGDGGSDGTFEHPTVLCPAVHGGAGGDDAGTLTAIDEFGPNAPAGKTASSLGRVNIYEVTSSTLLERIDIYMRADLEHTRVTIAVQEAALRTTPFVKIKDIQIDLAVCEGWASSGAVAIPLRAGYFYAIGFDPNQAVTPFVSADSESLPIDGQFGRLIGSKTATSVSVPGITWEKLTDKEYSRQRMATSPRAADSPADAAASDGGSDASDAPRG